MPVKPAVETVTIVPLDGAVPGAPAAEDQVTVPVLQPKAIKLAGSPAHTVAEVTTKLFGWLPVIIMLATPVQPLTVVQVAV
jgi:hypothetical protein